MADSVISIGAKVAEGFVKPTIRQGQYFFCVKKVIKNLGNEKNELIPERDRIQSLVGQAKERTEIIEDAVEKWLNDVNNLLEEVEKLEQEMKENHCCQGQFPTWRRYCLCKKMTKQTKAMAYLKNNSRSTKEAYNQLLEAIQDDNTSLIGLYGMGGSGKTNLVKEVGKKALELNLFDRVILVTVSQTPNIRSIQGKIADMLCMTLKEETEEGRAQRLWLRLKEEKRVLIIVDDVWTKLNMESIGIRLDGTNMLNFKVLLTTRLRQMCNSMECQKEIMLNLLSEEEAWTLFQKHARIGDKFSSNLLKVAREVSNECKGLPIAIEAVACSLKGKSDDEWKVALDSLRHSEPFDDHEGEGVRCAYNCVKLSYDYLRNKEAEMLLLLCSMFPEDHEIFIEDLIKYGVGLGICGNFDSFDLARSRIRAGINKLVDSCLLLHSTQSEHHVRMHDMVRDVALWIASKSEHYKILVNLAKDLNTLAEDEAMKDSFAVSSWCKETDTIYYQLDAPKLEILLINTMQANSLNFLFASSEGVKGLKVMAMINSFYRTPLLLPQSTHCMANLRTLRLRGWDLGDMSFLLSLTRLEVLDLSNCSFKDLPKGMEKLSKLKLLDLSHYEIPNLNYEAIGSCSQLEELYAFGYNRRCPCQHMEDIVTLPNLQRFIIRLGQFETHDNEESVRVLYLLDFNTSNLGASKQNLLQRAEDVCLNNLHGGCKNVIPDMVRVVGGMNELTKLCFCSCSEIDCLINTTYHHAGSFQVGDLLPKLIKLELFEMQNLTEVCRGPPLLALGFFKKLEKLYIRNCKQLYNIFPEGCNLSSLKILKIWNRHSSAIEALFSMPVARSLEQLEELLIQGCEQLKHIITRERGDGTNTGDNSHLVFSKLKKLSICECPKLEFIFPISFVQNGLSQLLEIEIQSASGLKYVFGQYDHEAHSSHPNQVQIMLPPLKLFNLYNVENLLGICPESFHLGFPSLGELDCQRCPRLITSCVSATIGSKQRQHLNNGVALDDDQQNQLTSNLRQLLLGGLPELKSIWSGTSPRQVLSFQFLQCLKVYSCANLKSVFSKAIKRSLPELTFLSISQCEELEEIVAENAEPQSLSNTEVCFPKLSELRIEKCNKLKSLFSVAMVRMLPQLCSIHISNAAQLEEAFRQSREENTDYGDQIMLPELKKMELQKLPSFGNIFKGFNFQAPKVEQLYIYKCPKFAPSLRGTQVNTSQNRTERRQAFWLIVATSNLQAFLNLEILHVTKSIEEGIFQLQVEGELGSNSNWNPLNSNLGYLTLCDLPALRFIWHGFSKFLSLEKLTHVSIRKCPKLKTIFSSGTVRCLPKLQSLSISKCEELEEIIALDLENAELSTVHISDGAQLENVSRHGSEDKTDNEDQIILPDLRKIDLKKLPSFVNIFQGFNFQAPKLQQLYIDVVPKFAQSRTQVNTSHQTTEKRQVLWLITATPNQLCKQRHHAALQASLNLEVLRVSNCGAEGIFQVEGEFGSRRKWKPLASNLEYLKLCDLPELRFIWKGLSKFLSLEKLTRISLSTCPKLKIVFPPSIVRCLPNLHTLRISNCEELEEIMSSNSKNAQFNHSYACTPQEVCFPRLYKITVEQCNKLKCLFYDFVARHFPELQSLEIRECCQIEQVLEFTGEAVDEDGKWMLFPKLKNLVLESLPIFSEISPGFNLPPRSSLQPLHECMARNCPKYNSSSTEASTSCLHTTTQKTQIFWLITATFNQSCEQGSSTALEAFLNVEVFDVRKWKAEGLFQLQVEGKLVSNSEWKPLNSNLHCLSLFDLPHLRYIWNGFSNFMSFEKLKVVSVVQCPKLKTIFSPCIVRYLPMLETMRISNCEELDEIMSLDPENTQLKHPFACPQQVCFPQLCEIEIKHCGKMKCLFYASMACHFPKLKSLEIKECCQLEQVFGYKREAEDESLQTGAEEHGKQILFPALHKLVLESLPIFFEISPRFSLSPEFDLQPWNEYLVVDCPKYNSTYI